MNQVSKAASLLSALGASKGGHARAASLSAERRKAIARDAVMARWHKTVGAGPDRCPDCEKGEYPGPDPSCTCREPLYISIPPGQHIHVTCPVHGDRILFGAPAPRMCATEQP